MPTLGPTGFEYAMLSDPILQEFVPDPHRGEACAVVDGQAVTIRDISDLVARVEARVATADGFTLFTLNLDHLVKRRQNATFRAAYARATFVTADGWPVVSLACTQDRDIARTTGADLIIPLCRLAARRRLPIALFGSTHDSLERAAARLRGLCPGLEIVWSGAPAFGLDPLGAAAAAAAAGIAQSGARICFVALGAPKQEIFSDRARERHSSVGFVCIGAGLDFIAGAQTRAPAVVRRLRLEWAWRLVCQPRRLARRYLDCALLFARLILRDPQRPTRRRDVS